MELFEVNSFTSVNKPLAHTDFIPFDYAKKICVIPVNFSASAFNVFFIGRQRTGAPADALLYKTGESMGRMHTAW